MNNIKNITSQFIGYAVNIGKYTPGDDIQYERYATFEVNQYSDGLECWNAVESVFKALTMRIEPRYWDIVEIEKIYQLSNGDWSYEFVKNGEPKRISIMENKSYWDAITIANPKTIYGIDVAVDCEDGKAQNICWLKLGYFSPLSNSGYFYYSSVREFDEAIKQIKHLSDADINVTQIKDYLDWLNDNECIFDKKKSQVYQIIGALYHR